jgi:mono/diheme cytochrome c family protein
MGKVLYGLGIAAIAVFACGWGPGKVHAGADDEAARPEFYKTRVRPIFQENCYRCHGGMNRRGGLSLATRAGILKGGKDGVVVVPGNPGASLLVKLIRHEGSAPDPKPMPPKTKLSDADIATVERWVRAGAVMPADAPPQ